MKKLLSLVLTFCMVFSCFVAFGSVDTYAATKTPARVKGVKGTSTTNSISLTWKKAKHANGYQIFVNNKKVKNTSKRSYTVKNLKPAKKYKIKVRAYYKQKLYYNSKTKKWVTKKPKKSQWKGKKTRNKYKYGKFSSVIKVKTRELPDTYPYRDDLENIRAEILSSINKHVTDDQIERGKDPVEMVETEEFDNMAQECAKINFKYQESGLDTHGDAFNLYGFKGDQWNYRKIKKFDFATLQAASEKQNKSAYTYYATSYWETCNYKYIGIGYYKGYLTLLMEE